MSKKSSNFAAQNAEMTTMKKISVILIGLFVFLSGYAEPVDTVSYHGADYILRYDSGAQEYGAELIRYTQPHIVVPDSVSFGDRKVPLIHVRGYWADSTCSLTRYDKVDFRESKHLQTFRQTSYMVDVDTVILPEQVPATTSFSSIGLYPRQRHNYITGTDTFFVDTLIMNFRDSLYVRASFPHPYYGVHRIFSASQADTFPVESSFPSVPLIFYNSVSIVEIDLSSLHITTSPSVCACPSLNRYILPEMVRTLNPISYCWALRDIKLPDSLRYMHPIYNCALDSLKFNQYTRIIAENTPLRVFGQNRLLKKFIVHPDNPYYYTDEQGLLYNKKRSKLLLIPHGTRNTVVIDVDSIDSRVADDTHLGWGGLDSLKCALLETETDFEIPCVFKSQNSDCYYLAPYAFYGMEMVSAIGFESTNITVLPEGCFWSTKLTQITLPPTLERIEKYSLCSNLDSIDFTRCSRLTTIQSEAFHDGILRTFNLYHCTSLQELPQVTHRDGIQHTYGGPVIYSLTAIMLPRSMRKLADYAFVRAKAVRSIVVPVIDPADIPITEKTFDGVNRPECRLTVPTKSVDAYKQAPVWKDFFVQGGLYALEADISDDEHGVITGYGGYYPGETATLTVTCTHGYHFVGWSDGDTSNPREVIMDQDTVLNAIIEEDPSYSLSLLPNDPERGYTVGSGTYYEGDTIQIEATSYWPYRFYKWSHNNIRMAIQTFIMPDSNTTLIAEFGPDTLIRFNLSVNTSPVDGGTVTGYGRYSAGEAVTLNAYANLGYEFYGWSHTTDTASTVLYTMPAKNVTLTAYFIKSNSDLEIPFNNSTDRPVKILKDGMLFIYYKNSLYDIYGIKQ